MKKIKFLIVLFPLLSGCYNYRELNDLGITTAISIDYEENFKIKAQVINPVKQQDATSSGEPTFVNFDSEGKSIQEALRRIILESPRQLYGSQLQLLILSEEVANNHLEEVLDFCLRDPEFRSEFKVLIAKNDESLNGIAIQTLLENLSSSNIFESLETQEKKEGVSLSITLNDLTNMYLNPYLEMTIPSMIVEGDIKEGEDEDNITSTVSKARVMIDTTGIFKDKKLVGYLSISESKALNLIKGELSDTIITLDIKDGYIAFEPNRLNTKTEVDIKKNKVKITIEGFSIINEVTSKIDLKSTKEIDKLEKELNNYIKKTINDSFNNIRNNYNTDVFGFQDLYYKTDAKYFKKNCQNWYQDIFPYLEIEVESKIKLYEKGNTLGGIEYERENQ